MSNHISFESKVILDKISDEVNFVKKNVPSSLFVEAMEHVGWQVTAISKKMVSFKRTINGSEQTVGCHRYPFFGWEVVETSFTH